MSNKIKPGLTLGLYPQRREACPGALEAQTRRVIMQLKFLFKQHKYTLKYILKRVNGFAQRINKLSGDAMQDHIQQLRQRLHQQGLQEMLIAESFATIREVSHRILGKKHFNVQILGGWVIINGLLAEMQTGEGKTLTAILPACTAALAGIPVHIITANDYLAKRDEELLRPLYLQMGLSSATVLDGMETELRKAAYQCDIVHTTSQQITFDYLLDRIEMGNQSGKLQIQAKYLQNRQQKKSSAYLLRGLCFTIIDEADNVLVDEAKTPLIISQTEVDNEQNQIYFDALFLAEQLERHVDFKVNDQYQDTSLTVTGKKKIAELAEALGDDWQQRRHREIMVTLALKATQLYIRDKHYLLRDDKIEIIDALTGRAMPDRSWEHGLHQLIEAKESCTISQQRNTLARITYQTFFKRYLHVSGMSGTLSEVAGELNKIYSLKVIKIPLHKPCRRQIQAEKVYKTNTQKWQALIQHVTKVHLTGQPILIGTNTVLDSKSISAILLENNLPHQVLNALQDQQEADVIALAGQLHSITVATNMAGRGTDIALGTGVVEIGGLHVIATTRNDARRIDRQLYGRCARQGDLGSTAAYMCLQDRNLADFYSPAMLKIISAFCLQNKALPHWLGNIILTLPQKWTEYQSCKTRRMLIAQDRKKAKTLSFTGQME